MHPVQAKIFHHRRCQAAVLELDEVAHESQAGPSRTWMPRPCIAKPDGWQHVDVRRLIAAIMDGHPNVYIVRCSFSVLDEDVKVSLVVQHACIDKFVLSIMQATAAVFGYQLSVWKCTLRIFVQRLHVRMCRRRVQVVIQLLDVLTMIPFRTTETEETFL